MSKSITQKMKYKQSVIKFSFKYGVKEAAKKFNEWPKTIYRWIERYDGTRQSLVNKSRRPHHHPREHTKQEKELVKRYKSQNKETGLVVLWVKLKKAGYTRSITSLYREMVRQGIYKKTPSKKKQYVPKPYEEMDYPGQRVQIDVKYVPQNCMSKELQ